MKQDNFSPSADLREDQSKTAREWAGRGPTAAAWLPRPATIETRVGKDYAVTMSAHQGQQRVRGVAHRILGETMLIMMVAEGFVDVPAGFRLSLISHFYSPLSTSIDSPGVGPAASCEIFMNDFTGDGTVGDPLPGTHFGSFDRGINASQLTGVINNFNSKYAKTATPAGRVLIANNLMSLQQLQGLGGVIPTISTPPPGQFDFTWLRAMDLKIAWAHTFVERFTIEPSVGFYNVGNFANFNLPPNTMNGLLNGVGSGSINGTDKAANNHSEWVMARVFTRSALNGNWSLA